MPLFIPGQKVTYRPLHLHNTSDKGQKGIVKSISDAHYTFVVYHCGDQWDDYENYTAARTYNNDLTYGWPTEQLINKVVEEINKHLY